VFGCLGGERRSELLSFFDHPGGHFAPVNYALDVTSNRTNILNDKLIRHTIGFGLVNHVFFDCDSKVSAFYIVSAF